MSRGRAAAIWGMSLLLLLQQTLMAQAQLVPGSNGAGRPVTGQTHFFHSDPVGSITVVSNASGRESARIVQTPYGALNIQSSSGSDDFRAKFAGKESDERSAGGSYSAPASNLSYFGARFYSPALGRFVSPDPARQFSNPYSYALGNPVTVTDPSGQVVEMPLLNSSLTSTTTADSSLIAEEAGVAVAGAATGPLDLVVISGLVILDLALLVASASPNASTAVAMTGGGYSAAIIPGTWSAAGSSRVAQAMSPLYAPYTIPFGSGLPPAVETLPGQTLLRAASAHTANQMGLPSGAAQTAVCPPLLGSSLPAGAQVMTPQGSVAIEDLRVGDKVLGYDERSGEVELNKVTRLLTRVATDIVALQLENGDTLLTTAKHPFLAQGGWREAGQLERGTILKLAHGREVELLAVDHESSLEIRVFNVEVEPNHTYLIGPSAAIVHNPIECTWAWRNLLPGPPPNVVPTPIVNYTAEEYIFNINATNNWGTGSVANITAPNWTNILNNQVNFYYGHFLPNFGNSVVTPYLIPNHVGLAHNMSAGGTGYDRGHILAGQNGGPGNNPNNIFAQWTYINRGWNIPAGTLVDPTQSTTLGGQLVNGYANNWGVPSYPLWRQFENNVNNSVMNANSGTLYIWLFR